MGKGFDWFRRRRDEALAIQRLNMLSDHLLRDIGFERGQIPQVVRALVRAEYDGVTRDLVTHDVAALGTDSTGVQAPTVQSGAKAYDGPGPA